MKKFLWILVAAVCMLTTSCSSDDDSTTTAAVGILTAKITPEGSAVSYDCTVDHSKLTIDNTVNPVQWDVTDAALKQTTLTVTTTLGATAYAGSTAITSDGVEIDATAPVSITVKDAAGNSKTYTLNVTRSETATGDDMIIKSSTLKGLPQTGLLDYDMAYFNDRFYAAVTSLTDKVENYQLFTSDDGVNWTEVNYQTPVAGLTLPEGQTAYVIGGEGAHFATFGGKLYLMGGARTYGADKYGNASEGTDWGWGPIKQLNTWRSYSTSDGTTFTADTLGMKYTKGGEAAPSSRLACTDMSFAELNGKLYMANTLMFSFGMAQNGQLLSCSDNGRDWTTLDAKYDDGTENSVNVGNIRGGAFFSFKGKLWMIGGLKGYIDAKNCTNAVLSSTDGVTWTKEADLPEGMTGLVGARVVANGDVAYMFGGQIVGTDGNTFMPAQIYRSTDGKTWEAVDTPAGFTPRRDVRVVLVGNTAWLFGGLTTTSTGSYYYVSDQDVLGTDTWVKLIK